MGEIMNFLGKLGLSVCVVSSLMVSANAGPRLNAVQKEVVNISRAEKRLARKLSYLNQSERIRIKSRRAGVDSDSDGVSDIVEGALGSNRCDSDSDDDGFDDKSDSNEDSPGSDDGLDEFEVKGFIESYSDPVLKVNGATYTVSASAQFVGVGFSREDLLQAGACVELKGLKRESGNTVTRLKQDNDCGSED
jgi:hypothetical protein